MGSRSKSDFTITFALGAYAGTILQRNCWPEGERKGEGTWYDLKTWILHWLVTHMYAHTQGVDMGAIVDPTQRKSIDTYVQQAKQDLALKMAISLKAGACWVNCHNLFHAAVGFGGYRESGYRRDEGKEVRTCKRHQLTISLHSISTASFLVSLHPSILSSLTFPLVPLPLFTSFLHSFLPLSSLLYSPPFFSLGSL